MIKETFTRLSAAKKENIIQKSHQVFAELGFDSVTVRDIVQATEIPRGSFYQYFDSTLDVFNACLEDISQKKLDFMQPFMMDAGQKPFIVVYKTLIEKGIEFAMLHPLESKSALVLYNTANKELLKIKYDFEARGVSLIKDMIEKDQKSGFMSSFVDASVLARMLYHFNAFDLIEKFKLGHTSDELMAYAENFLNIIENGIN